MTKQIVEIDIAKLLELLYKKSNSYEGVTMVSLCSAILCVSQSMIGSEEEDNED